MLVLHVYGVVVYIYGGCRELMDLVKTESRRMIDAQPSESAIGNMARRGQAVFLVITLTTQFQHIIIYLLNKVSFIHDNYRYILYNSVLMLHNSFYLFAC